MDEIKEYEYRYFYNEGFTDAGQLEDQELKIVDSIKELIKTKCGNISGIDRLTDFEFVPIEKIYEKDNVVVRSRYTTYMEHVYVNHIKGKLDASLKTNDKFLRIKKQFEYEGRCILYLLKQFISQSKKKHKHNVCDDRYTYFYYNYKTAQDKSDIYCKIHGFFEQNANNHKSQNGCPRCGRESTANSSRFSIEYVKEYLNSVNLSLLDDAYISNSKPLRLLCNICKYEWDTTRLSSIRGGSNCPKCARSRVSEDQKKYTSEYVKLYLDTLDLDLISEYINTNAYIKVKCKLCEYEWACTFSARLGAKNGCRRCAGYAKYTQEYVLTFLLQKNITTSTIYESANKYLDLICKICNHNWNTTFHKLHSDGNGGTGCPKCNRGISKGQKIVEEYLNDKNIKYKIEKRFEDCIFTQKLRYDLYIENKNLLKEYDGKQHFYNNNFFYSSKDTFLDRVKKDRIKNSYSFVNSISLLRLSYLCKKDDIHFILNKTFSKVRKYPYLKFYITKRTYILLKRKPNLVIIKIKIENSGILTDNRKDVFNVYRNAIKDVLDTSLHVTYPNEIFTADIILGKTKLLIPL